MIEIIALDNPDRLLGKTVESCIEGIRRTGTVVRASRCSAIVEWDDGTRQKVPWKGVDVGSLLGGDIGEGEELEESK